jgi:hypothetical protein
VNINAGDRKVGATPLAQVATPMNPFLGLLPTAMWDKQKDFFIYSVEFLPLAVSATATQPIAIQSDSHFLVEFITGVVTDTTNATFIANVPELALITDSGSGRQFMDRPIHWNNVFGTAQLPSVLPFPKIINAGSTVTVQLTNLEATARNVRIAFLGFKVFGF